MANGKQNTEEIIGVDGSRISHRGIKILTCLVDGVVCWVPWKKKELFLCGVLSNNNNNTPIGYLHNSTLVQWGRESIQSPINTSPPPPSDPSKCETDLVAHLPSPLASAN